MPNVVKALFPAAEVVRCARGLSHSFMLDGSDAIAKFVGQRLLSAR